MALESFGTMTAKQIDHAVQLCHDMLKDDDGSFPLEFQAGVKGIWRVEPGSMDGEPAVVIKLGVG